MSSLLCNVAMTEMSELNSFYESKNHKKESEKVSSILLRSNYLLIISGQCSVKGPVEKNLPSQ